MLNQLEHLYQGKNLTIPQTTEIFEEILTGGIDSSKIAALLVALKTKGESIEEIAGAANALRKQAMDFPVSDYSVTDCCGTGGDGFNTINVSTLSAFVASSMGIKVAKHGNRSVSSQCGSSDLMQAFGINTHASPSQSKQELDSLNFCFLLAPDYHQGVKHVMPVRQSLKTRTIFNLIGPLANPASPDIQLIGVYDKKYCVQFAEILNILGTKRAMVVHGSGLDEIAVHDSTEVAYLKDGVINTMQLTPELLGVKQHSIESIQVDSIENNVQAGMTLLQGRAPEAHIDMVAVNTGAVLFLNDRADTLKDAVSLAKRQILSGKPYHYMQKIKESSND